MIYDAEDGTRYHVSITDADTTPKGVELTTGLQFYCEKYDVEWVDENQENIDLFLKVAGLKRVDEVESEYLAGLEATEGQTRAAELLAAELI